MQLCDNRKADQRLSFHYIASTIPLLLKPLAIFCDSTARFVSDLVGKPEDRFSHDAAHIKDVRMAGRKTSLTCIPKNGCKEAPCEEK